MPKRSNPYQRLALFVHKSLGPDWEIRESETLTDMVTGQAREVDIVAKRSWLDHEIVLSIECRAHRRAADVTWIEAMAKKHEHLATSKLVLWSRNGFTRKALAKANALKIDTVSQEQSGAPMWANLARDLVGGHVLYVAPIFRAFLDVTMPDGSMKRFDSVENWSLFNADGVEAGPISALAQLMTQSKDVRSVILDNAPVGVGSFWAQFVPPTPLFVDIPSGQRCSASRIGVGIETVAEKPALELISAPAETSVITLATAEVKRGMLEFVIEEDERGAKRIGSQLLIKRS